jgi:hypothetical protein
MFSASYFKISCHSEGVARGATTEESHNLWSEILRFAQDDIFETTCTHFVSNLIDLQTLGVR